MRFFLLICLLFAVYGMTVGVVREYFYVKQSKHWTEAQRYCRENYKDLATITSEEENQSTMTLPGPINFLVWIGLNRTVSQVNIWQWSDGEKVNFTNWHMGEPNDGSKKCAVIAPDGWYDADCGEGHTSICYRRFTLVKESKTWEEAHEDCRSNFTDLAIVDSETLLDLLQTETEQAQTASVWTGLRFLHGTWLWVNGTLLESLVSLPSCPVEPYRCAAYNFNTYVWENRACNEELNFICYE